MNTVCKLGGGGLTTHKNGNSITVTVMLNVRQPGQKEIRKTAAGHSVTTEIDEL